MKRLLTSQQWKERVAGRASIDGPISHAEFVQLINDYGFVEENYTASNTEASALRTKLNDAKKTEELNSALWHRIGALDHMVASLFNQLANLMGDQDATLLFEEKRRFAELAVRGGTYDVIGGKDAFLRTLRDAHSHYEIVKIALLNRLHDILPRILDAKHGGDDEVDFNIDGLWFQLEETYLVANWTQEYDDHINHENIPYEVVFDNDKLDEHVSKIAAAFSAILRREESTVTMRKTCSKCGADLQGREIFCYECGSYLSWLAYENAQD